MKVALTRSSYHSHLITPPLGLGYLSAYLKQRGYEVKIIDGLNNSFSADEIVERCRGFDLIGITCMSDYFLETVDLAKRLKKHSFKVVIGGAHATALPRFTLEQSGADYVIVGEGEATLYELVERLESGADVQGLAGIVTQESEHFVNRPLIQDLDSLPFPDWEQMDPGWYRKAPHGGLIKNFPVAPLISSRGCPFACSFCASPKLWGRKIRFRSPENVVAEIAHLVKGFGAKEIHFEDDNLTLSREHIEAICTLILQKRIKISWAVPNGIRVDTVDYGLLSLMRQSGCYYVAFGIESSDQGILNRVKKNTDLKMVARSVRLANKVGMITQGFFIFGLPGETRETIHNTVAFAKTLPLDRAQFLLLDVLPGSELWDKLRNVMDIDWNKRSYQEVSWVPDTIDRKTLALSVARAFRSFFFRPKQLISLLRYFRFSQMRFVLRRLIDFNLLPIMRKAHYFYR